jgi:hypothetical protein
MGTPVRSNHGVALPYQSDSYACGRGALCLKRTGVLNLSKSLWRGTNRAIAALTRRQYGHVLK